MVSCAPCINYEHSRRGYAFPVRICIPGEDVHSRWVTSPFSVRMFIPLWVILTGNAHSLYRMLWEIAALRHSFKSIRWHLKITVLPGSHLFWPRSWNSNTETVLGLPQKDLLGFMPVICSTLVLKLLRSFYCLTLSLITETSLNMFELHNFMPTLRPHGNQAFGTSSLTFACDH